MTLTDRGIRDALLRDYGIEGKVRSLPGEYDLNFDVTAATGRFVFKVMRADCDPQFVEMQIAAMENARAAGLVNAIPDVIRPNNGATHTTVVTEDGEHRIAWLISFLPGTLMAHVEPWTPALAASIGELLGRLDHALANFDYQLLDRELKWDLCQSDWIAKHAAAIDDTARRAHIERILRRFTDELKPTLDALPRSAIYNDANDMNIFVAKDSSGDHATGIIDFGDMIRAPRVCEPAVAMAYAMMGPGDPLTRGAALARAYHHAYPLTEEEIAILAPLVKVRLAVTVTNAALQRSENPDNKYLTISEAPAWRLLDYLDVIGDNLLEHTIRDACSDAATPSRQTASTSLLARRHLVTPSNQTLSYDNPLHIVRGSKHFLYDADGVEYLDVYNNVPHVGHAHPHVVDAVARQLSLLNTNTRYLQDVHVDYAERMLARLPAHLTKIVFLNSGSEANELALRLARAATGARDMIVMDHGYHGNTTGAMDISPYKFMHPRGPGVAPDWVHVTSQPDVYRGNHRGEAAPDLYVADFRAVLDGIIQSGRQLAGFICECVPSVGGQIVLPPGYLNSVYAMVRAAGGICIADDVQTGLGRLGQWFWGFEQQDAAPDVAVWGKPIGNGFPLAAVAMTDDIAESFARGPEFFSTFGGSSAACVAGAAVLDVLRDEDLPARARVTGDTLLTGLKALSQRHEIIGDVRGYGLFLGVELVRDRNHRYPATNEAARINNLLRENRVLLGLEGPDSNVLKIRPPMSFDDDAAEQLLTRLDEALTAVE
ncbi:MAG: aminotransferase class III-fold pyridoxal phosphate-dependent enzyme [Gemmatimonadaceae bacterium]